MIAILPASAQRDADASAILRSDGVGVLLDRASAPASIALYTGALIETQKNSIAHVQARQFTADIKPETMVQFEGNELLLEHGSLSVNTSRGLRVRVGCLTVTPVLNDAWTLYDVTDVDGKVTVWARTNDVNLDSSLSNLRPDKHSMHSDRDTVRQGKWKSRAEKCGATGPTPPPDAHGPWLNSPWAKGAGLAAITALTCWSLCRSDDPISPWSPSPPPSRPPSNPPPQ